MQSIIDCSRTKPHDGPCNGWQTPECTATAYTERDRAVDEVLGAFDVNEGLNGRMPTHF